MKRNLIYFIVLIALGACVYFLVIKKPWATLNEKETAFAVNDTASITKIFIADMKGNKVTLQRNNDSWLLNNTYVADQHNVNILLSTIKNMSVGFPVAEAAQKNVVTELASENKKVELYDSQGKLLRSFFVGGPATNADGSYMLMEGSEHPYVMVIPGFQGFLDTRFITDAQKLRSTNIFHYSANQIESISVSYANGADTSFIISILGPDSFEIKNQRNAVIPSVLLDKGKINSFISLFRFINCEGFVNDLPKKDTVLATSPFCTITVVDRHQQQNSVVCYFMPKNETSPQVDQQGNELKYDIDHYFATINNGNDFVIIQDFVFRKLFRTFNFFVKKPTTR